MSTENNFKKIALYICIAQLVVSTSYWYLEWYF